MSRFPFYKQPATMDCGSGQVAENLIEDYKSKDAYPYYYKKEDNLEWLNHMKNLLESNDASTREIDELVKEFDK